MEREIMKQFFPEFVERIDQGKCPFCKKEIDKDEFKDELSISEFKISGLCQKCQDKTFTE